MLLKTGGLLGTGEWLLPCFGRLGGTWEPGDHMCNGSLQV